MITIRAEAVQGKDLQPGDLFSTVGPNYWNHINEKRSVGERVYIRTDEPAESFPDMDTMVYRITVVRLPAAAADSAGEDSPGRQE